MEKTTPQTLRFARHVVGMAIVALANPLIYFSSENVAAWAATWIMPILFAAALFGLYALFFTQRAKAAWPRSFFILAWVILLLVLAGPYLEKFNRRVHTSQTNSQPPLAGTATESEINAALGNAHSQTREYLTDEEIGFKAPAQPSGATVSNSPNVAAAYTQKVYALRRAVESGSLPIVTIRQEVAGDSSLGNWPAPDVAEVERTQTWWVSDGLVWMHVPNRSIYKIDVIYFDHAHSSCATLPAVGKASYVIHLQRPIQPGTEAMVQFAAEDLSNGCLTIVGIRG